MFLKPGAGGLTRAEAAGSSSVAFLAFVILFAYFTDWVGLRIVPGAILVLSLASTLGLLAWLWPQATRSPGDLAALAGVVCAVLAWLLWLAWPDLLPRGGDSDLAHHLQLVEHIDRHWRLVHDPALEAFLGEMAHYTPGAHLLASLLGAWGGTDGFHAVHTAVACSVAIKTGFVFLIARRVAAAPFALIAVAVLFLPIAFYTGSFTSHSYIAQVVAELFAVAMWWALVAWDGQPSAASVLLFAIAGMATFLTWPIWIGPPMMVLAVVVLARRELPLPERLRTLTLATLPIAAAAAAHLLGRVAWTRIARTDAAMAVPSLTEFNGWFLGLSLIGVVALAADRRSRATALLIAASTVQAAALYVAATTDGAKVPYMAIKMAYLAIYPLAVGSALALALAWRAAGRAASPRLAWALAAVALAAAGRQAVANELGRPIVSEPLYVAARWARDHTAPGCVDYIVPQSDTAYWLHLAVLGNRRMSARTADDRTYVARDAIVRWINGDGPPFAVADLGILPKDVLLEAEELARFDSAVVIGRRGAAACEGVAGR